MENVNQDAMLNEQSRTFKPDTGGTDQTPDDSIMMNEDYNPADLSGDAHKMPTTPTDEQDAANPVDRSGAASGSPNMEPDVTNYGNGDSLGNNDGTEPDPEQTDPMPPLGSATGSQE
ncbi:hypothetical protein HNV11_15165 [Spirosoma taeanense]|uniref:Uncharacterized protein n=1 Tax=Spirosoma taeanense TaxID=2735870 RepID=A0A6M5Y8L0_9BACT|nr:hypothetical protein [Spirosoma taeanense]QJW90627.1 hypothetical protein HNV11_15165 [Spirosoma taeanense]